MISWDEVILYIFHVLVNKTTKNHDLNLYAIISQIF